MKLVRARAAAVGTSLAAKARVAALAIAIVGAPSLAWAGTPAQDLETAEEDYVNLDYAEANRIADSIVKRHGLSHDELVRSYRVLALTSAVLDKPAPAKQAFIYLLTYDPQYKVDANLAPRVQDAFREALGYWRAQPQKPGLEALTNVHASTGGTLRVTTRDPTHITRRIVVGYRWNPGAWVTTDVNPDEVTLELPPAPSGSSRFDYYVSALDARDNEVFALGSPTAPKVVVVDAHDVAPVVVAEKHRSIWKSPVFWTITSIVIAGAAAGTTIALLHDRKTVTTTVQPTTGTLTPTITCPNGLCQ